MYTTIQLPRNGYRLLSHQSPSLRPARPGPAPCNKTIKTTTTTQSSLLNAPAPPPNSDTTNGAIPQRPRPRCSLPLPGATPGHPWARCPELPAPCGAAHPLLGCPRGAGGHPLGAPIRSSLPWAQHGSARRAPRSRFMADIIFYGRIKPKLRWLYGCCAGIWHLAAQRHAPGCSLPHCAHVRAGLVPVPHWGRSWAQAPKLLCWAGLKRQVLGAGGSGAVLPCWERSRATGMSPRPGAGTLSEPITSAPRAPAPRCRWQGTSARPPRCHGALGSGSAARTPSHSHRGCSPL